MVCLEFKKSLRGYKTKEVKAYISAYESDFKQKNAELVQQIDELTSEIETITEKLESFKLNEVEFERIEAEIKENLFSIYIDSTRAICMTDKDFNTQEEELNDRVNSREIELLQVKRITDQLCNEIELLTKGYDHVLKGEVEQ